MNDVSRNGRDRKASQKRAKRIVVYVIFAAVFSGVAWLVTRQEEPTYDGRRLTSWMAALGGSDEDEEAHAFAAIEAIGTNGLPVIVRLLRTRDSGIGAQLLRLGRNIPFLHLPFTTPAERRQKGKMALVLAGEESMKASIPELVRLSHDTDAGVRLPAIEALSGFASNETNNLPALEAAQANPDFRVRAAALQAVQLRRAVEREVERLRNL